MARTPEQRARYAEKERQRREANREEYNAKARQRREEQGAHIRALDNARYANDPNVREKKIEGAKRQARKDPAATAEYSRKYREENRDALIARQRALRLDPARRPRILLSQKNSNYKNAYGLTLEQRDSLLAAQGGTCGLCKRPIEFRSGGASVDHCHSSKKIRAILCPHCNRGLGHFFDNPELLRAAALYIEKHRG